MLLLDSFNHSEVLNLFFNLFNSTNHESYSRGVLSELQYEDGKKRRLTNLQICFMGWIFESTGNVITILAPSLNFIHGLHYLDAIMMFVLIPFAHLMNDEDTKTVITEESWYQGFRHMLGIHNSPQQ